MTTSRKLPISYNISTFGDGTRDYISLSAWEAVTKIDLVSAEKGEVLDCYADLSEYDDHVNLSGATTNKDYFRIVRAAPGEEHDGTPYTGVRFIVPHEDSRTAILYVNESNSGFYDLVVKYNANSTGRRIGIMTDKLAHNSKIVGCIVYDTTNSSGTCRGIQIGNLGFGDDSGYAINCIVINTGSPIDQGGAFIGWNNGDHYFINCTAVFGQARGFASPAPGAGGYCELYAINCISQDHDGPEISGTNTKDHCVEGGVIFEDPLNYDFHLNINDTAARGNGISECCPTLVVFDDDIDQDIRYGNWDIGADQYTPPNFEISGTVTENGSPLSGVLITFSHNGHTETTDINGEYSYSCGSVQTIITPSKSGYIFNPENANLQVTTSDIIQDFITTELYLVSGHITDNNTGVNGVNVIFGFDNHLEITNSLGYYSYYIPKGTSTTIYVLKVGYSFSPESGSVWLTINAPTIQDFTATSLYSGIGKYILQQSGFPKEFDLGNEFDYCTAGFDVCEIYVSDSTGGELPPDSTSDSTAEAYISEPFGISPQGYTYLPQSLLFTSSPFEVHFGSDSHYQSHWQISKDINFNNIIKDVISGTNLTSITFSISDIDFDDTPRYWRVKYKGNSLDWSEWSDFLTFSTESLLFSLNTGDDPSLTVESSDSTSEEHTWITYVKNTNEIYVIKWNHINKTFSNEWLVGTGTKPQIIIKDNYVYLTYIYNTKVFMRSWFKESTPIEQKPPGILSDCWAWPQSELAPIFFTKITANVRNLKWIDYNIIEFDKPTTPCYSTDTLVGYNIYHINNGIKTFIEFISRTVDTNINYTVSSQYLIDNTYIMIVPVCENYQGQTESNVTQSSWILFDENAKFKGITETVNIGGNDLGYIEITNEFYYLNLPVFEMDTHIIPTDDIAYIEINGDSLIIGLEDDWAEQPLNDEINIMPNNSIGSILLLNQSSIPI